MRKSQDWNWDTEDTDSERMKKAEKRKRWYMYAKITRVILGVVWIVACAILLYTMAPYATGKEMLEDPMSNSQIQGILTILVICFAMTKVKI